MRLGRGRRVYRPPFTIPSGIPYGNLVPMPTQRHAARKRLRPDERARLIEQSATRLFAEQGYASTSVDEIVNAAGVTKPMLYRHFESKQELCIRLLRRCRDDLASAPLAELGVDGPATVATSGPLADVSVGQIERMIDAWLAWAEAYPDGARLLFTPIRGDETVVEVQREMYMQQRDMQAALLCEFVPGLSSGRRRAVGRDHAGGFRGDCAVAARVPRSTAIQCALTRC